MAATTFPLVRSLTLLLLLALTTCATPLGKRSLLVIGDSNGEREGWAYQFQELRGGGPFVNTSLSGNTLGYDYGSNTSMNTLENLTTYLRRGYAEMGAIDDIIIMLGTNDCKARFRDNRSGPGDHLIELLERTNRFFNERGQPAPRIVVATPPSFGPDDKVPEEFRGGQECISTYSRQVLQIAQERGLCVVNLRESPGDDIQVFSEDGIHFSEPGYVAIARAILDECY